jgi:hypothetical protein
MKVKDILNIVFDEQWLCLSFDKEDGWLKNEHIKVWGADWIGGYKPTIKELNPYLDCEVDDMDVEEFDDPECDGEKAQMICVTVYPIPGMSAPNYKKPKSANKKKKFIVALKVEGRQEVEVMAKNAEEAFELAKETDFDIDNFKVIASEPINCLEEDGNLF